MSESLNNALSSANIMIEILKSKIRSIEEFKMQLSEYDHDLNDAEKDNLWELINKPYAWDEDYRGDPTFCAGKNEQKIIRNCIQNFDEFARSRITDYDDI